IITRDVPGSEFKYAKILTLPFFGTGLVEIPPEGFKRAKNSRKMQMVFFVYEGKVLVEIGAQGLLEGGEGSANEFAITKGGVWVVPR
ncbi:mitotic fidelity of chromosome transmission-related protein, partial [Friedmanniomyces endolithicus]